MGATCAGVAQSIPLQSGIAMAFCPESFREREEALREFMAGGGVHRRRSNSGSDHPWAPEMVFVCTPSRVMLLRMVPTVMQACWQWCLRIPIACVCGLWGSIHIHAV